jgi:hypothetical protein
LNHPAALKFHEEPGRSPESLDNPINFSHHKFMEAKRFFHAATVKNSALVRFAVSFILCGIHVLAQDARQDLTLSRRPAPFSDQCETRRVALKAANGRFVSADGGLGGILVADRERIGDWERFDMLVFDGKKIVFKAWNGKFVAPRAGENNRLYASAAESDAGSTFTIVEEKGKSASLRASNGLVVSADLGLKGVLVADRKGIGAWEKFEIFPLEEDSKPRPGIDEQAFLKRLVPGLNLDLFRKIARAQAQHAADRDLRFLKQKPQYSALPPVRTLQRYESGLVVTQAIPAVDFGKNQLVPGDWFFIDGRGFGEVPGKVALVLKEPVAGMRTYSCDSQGMSWTADRIAARMPLVPGLKQDVEAELVVSHKEGRVLPASLPVLVGPRRIVYQTSGRQYFLPAVNDREFLTVEESPDKKFTVVLHDPSCGWVGDDGVDTFDLRALPAGCRLEKMIFLHCVPDRIDAIREWLSGQIDEIVQALIRDGIPGLIAYSGRKVIEFVSGLIDSEAGKYAAYVLVDPSESMPIAMIRWHNTCWGLYKDFKLVYMVSLLVSGPEGLAF